MHSNKSDKNRTDFQSVSLGSGFHVLFILEAMESSRSGARIVKAKAPLAEMFGYVTALRTITSGRATSTMSFSHYAEVSTSIAKQVLTECDGRVDLLK